MSPLNEVNETKPVAQIGRLKNFFKSKFKDYVYSDFEMFSTFLKLVLQYFFVKDVQRNFPSSCV